MMKVLITGTTGLVGSRLLPRLVDDGHDCRVLVRSDRPVPPGARRARRPRRSRRPHPCGPGSRRRGPPRGALPHRRRSRDLEGQPRRHAPPPRRRHRPRSRCTLRHGQHRQRLRPGPGPARPGERPLQPTAAYPASKVAAEELLRPSGLTWSVLRLPFVYGDGDGHLAAMPVLATGSACIPRTPTPWPITATWPPPCAWRSPALSTDGSST